MWHSYKVRGVTIVFGPRLYDINKRGSQLNLIVAGADDLFTNDVRELRQSLVPAS